MHRVQNALASEVCLQQICAPGSVHTITIVVCNSFSKCYLTLLDERWWVPFALLQNMSYFISMFNLIVTSVGLHCSDSCRFTHNVTPLCVRWKCQRTLCQMLFYASLPYFEASLTSISLNSLFCCIYITVFIVQREESRMYLQKIAYLKRLETGQERWFMWA